MKTKFVKTHRSPPLSPPPSLVLICISSAHDEAAASGTDGTAGTVFAVVAEGGVLERNGAGSGVRTHRDGAHVGGQNQLAFLYHTPTNTHTRACTHTRARTSTHAHTHAHTHTHTPKRPKNTQYGGGGGTTDSKTLTQLSLFAKQRKRS